MTRRLVMILFVASALAMAPPAQALPITGSLSFSAPGGASLEVLPIDAMGNLLPDFMGAKGLDFTATGVPSPGIDGKFTVSAAFGSFAGMGGMAGFIKDFMFAAPAVGPFQAPPITAWQTVAAFNNFSFDLSAITFWNIPNGEHVDISGIGWFHMTGFDDTLGSFSLGATKNGTGVNTTFSFAGSESAPLGVPDSGSSLLLIGLGLVGIVAGKKVLV